jgi:outer membrane protein TolC
MKIMYKKSAIAIFIILGLALHGHCEEAKSGRTIELSLQEAVETAFKNNKEIRIQEAEILYAKGGVLDARSQFLPKVNLNAGYTRNGTVLEFPGKLIKKDPGIFTGYKNDNLASASISQSIYSGGANTANLKQSQLNLKVQEETLRASKLDVEFETNRLYYGLLLAYETERIAQELVNQTQSHYEDVKIKFSHGTVSKFDVLQSKVQVSLVEPELIKAKSSTDYIAAQLKKLLGFRQEDTLILKDPLKQTLVEIRESEFLMQAYLNKPEIILKGLGVDINKWAIAVAKAGYRPQINADANYNYTSNDLGDMFNTRHNNWYAGFSMTMPVFDGFASKAKVEEARARYAQALLDKENLSEQIAVDIKKACLDLRQAQAIIDATKDNVEEAKEALRLSQVRFDYGEGINLDILDAQVSLSQIEQNLSSAIYDYIMAKAFLDRNLGKGLLEEAKHEKKD